MMILFFDGILALLFLTACLGFVELSRVVVYRIAIDWIEIETRYNQMIIDNDKQRLKLEWSEAGILQLTDKRKQLQNEIIA